MNNRIKTVSLGSELSLRDAWVYMEALNRQGHVAGQPKAVTGRDGKFVGYEIDYLPKGA